VTILSLLTLIPAALAIVWASMAALYFIWLIISARFVVEGTLVGERGGYDHPFEPH